VRRVTEPTFGALTGARPNCRSCTNPAITATIATAPLSATVHHNATGTLATCPLLMSITDNQIATVIAYIRSEQQRLGFEQ
jgi:hypothetical protein